MKWTQVGLLAILVAAGCSKVTIQQQPFDPLMVQAKRPAPPPARVVLTHSSIKITEKIQFQVGKADILEVSFGLLDEIAKVMAENEQIELVQIEGHTELHRRRQAQQDAVAAARRQRAQVLDGQGNPAKRLVAKGFGPEVPVGDNATPEGREANRRVEFNILKQGPKKTMVQDE